MRSFARWLPAVVGVFLAAAPAWALPQPKLPPEATDKPSVVVRVRPVAELLKDAAYVAKLVGQEEVFNAIEPGLAPVLEVLDTSKPIGFYAKVRAAGIDSQGVLLLPVKGEKELLGTLAQFGQNPTEGAGGLYTLNVPAPFPVIFRFAHGYVYATVKNTPDAEAALDKAKVYRPEALFTAGDNALASVTVNLDAIPNDLKKQALGKLEEVLKQVNDVELAREKNPAVRRVLTTAAEEIAIKVQSLIVDAQTASWRFDFDRKAEQMALGFRLTARGGSDLANEIATLGTGTGLGAGVAKEPSAIQGAVSIAVPATIKKAFEPLVDEFLTQAWKTAPADKQELAKELLEALTPTIKSGLLDAGFDFHGPGPGGFLSVVVGVRVKEGDKLDGMLRKVYGMLPANEKRDVTLDVDKSDGVGIHRAPAKLDAKGALMFSADAKTLFAFRKDLALVAIGPEQEALAAIKGSLQASEKPTKIVQGKVSVRGMAKVAEAKEERVFEAARKAYPEGVDDQIRFEISGGAAVEARFSASTRLIQFGVLVEQARRGR